MSEVTGSVGQVLAGRYRLVAPLGEGGMGSVWRAEHLTLGTPVAVKLVHPSVAARPGMLARFLREAQSAARLRSVHVVQILDHGESDGVPFIAMECLEGESLADRLERERTLTPAATAEISTSVCRALVRAHRMGIVHRDLKPDNIFIARDEGASVVKVLDFGIAKLIDLGEASPTERTETSDRTETGTVLGTPRYMSPEQARGRSAVDGRSDLWSLAVITFECLTGRRPFEAATMGDLILQICADDVPVPSSVGEVPPGFDAWFARATRRDPRERFATASAFAKALAAVLTPDQPWLDAGADLDAAEEPDRAVREERTKTSSGGAAAGPLAASPRPSGAWKKIVGAALATCAVGAGVAFATRGPAAPVAPPGLGAASAASLPQPETILGVSRPTSCKPAAADATMDGLRGLRGADWHQADAAFQRALDEDPECATPTVLLVAMQPYAGNVSNLDDLRQRYRRLASRQSELSAHDAALWTSMEPYMLRDPPDGRELAKRFREAAVRLPNAPLIAHLAALAVENDAQETLRLEDQALAEDPTFADAQQVRARSLDALGRSEEAVAAINRCTAAAPTSQCVLEQLAALSTAGRCDDMAKGARSYVLSSGAGEESYQWLGWALAAQSGSEGAAMEAFAQQAGKLGGDLGPLFLARNGAHLDVTHGRMDAAQKKARDLGAQIAGAPGAFPHEAYVELQAKLWLEAERPDELRTLSSAFFDKHPVWTPDPLPDSATPALIQALFELGVMPESERARRTASWYEFESAKATSHGGTRLWTHRARLAMGRDEARALLNAAPPTTSLRMGGWIVEAWKGKLELDLDAVDESRAHLAAATRSCGGHLDPFLFLHAHLWLGRALERSGDDAGACKAYAVVLERWGKSKPTPRTAREAAKRSRALKCGPH